MSFMPFETNGIWHENIVAGDDIGVYRSVLKKQETLEVFDRRNKYGSVTYLKTKSKITKSKFSFCLTPKKEYLGEKQAIINLHFYRMLHRLEAENFSLKLWEISVKL